MRYSSGFPQSTISSLSDKAVSYIQCGVIIGVNLPATPWTYESFIPPYPPALAPRTGFARPSRLHLSDLNTVLLTEHRQSGQGMTVSPV